MARSYRGTGTIRWGAQDGKDGVNYLIMGWWSANVHYKLTDAGIPVVKVKDTSPDKFSVYKLTALQSTLGLFIASEWEKVKSADFVYMQDAYIERLQAVLVTAERIEALNIVTSKLEVTSGAKIGGFTIEGGWLKAVVDAYNSVTGFISIVSSFIKIRFGSDLIPATAGGVFTLLGEIENNIPSTGFAQNEENIALRLKATQKVNNTALDAEGDILLRGNLVQMNRMHVSAGFSDSIKTNIGRFDTYFFKPHTYSVVNLPTLFEMRAKMRGHTMSDSTFTIKIIVGYSASSSIALRGSQSATLMDNNGNVANSSTYAHGQIDMAKGDTMILQFCEGSWYVLSNMK